MALRLIPAPELTALRVGSSATLLLMEVEGLSFDGGLLLMRATFLDSGDVSSVFHYGLWTFDVRNWRYVDCLNALVAGTAPAASVEILDGAIAGPASGATVLVEVAPRGAGEPSTLALLRDGSLVTRDLVSTVLGLPMTIRVERHALSQDGRFLAVQTDDPLVGAGLPADENDVSDVYLFDLRTNTVARVSQPTGGELTVPALLGSLAVVGDRVRVGFTTDGAYVAADVNGALPAEGAATDAYQWSSSFDLSGFEGAAEFTLLSRATSSQAAGFAESEFGPIPTLSGTYFTSRAGGLVAGDTNGAADVFLLRDGQTVSRVSTLQGAQLSAGAALVSASADGRWLTLLTESPEVGGTAQVRQFVLLDTQTNAWTLLSQAGQAANDLVAGGALSHDGSTYAFTSAADNLGAGSADALAGSLYLGDTGFRSTAAVSGFAYHWKSHALLSGATMQAVDRGAVAQDSGIFDLRAAAFDPVSGVLRVEVWTATASAVHSVGFAVTSASITSANFVAALPAGWIATLNTDNPAALRFGALDADALGSGLSAASKIGTLELKLASGISAADLRFSSVEVGTTAVADLTLRMRVATTDAEGDYRIAGLEQGDWTLSAQRSVSDIGTAVTSSDALAALRIAVGINPNPDPDGNGPLAAPPVSPYQIIAADVNGDGVVKSNDALAILRMAVGSLLAPAKGWLFVEETRDFWDETRSVFSLGASNARWERGTSLSVDSELSANLVGVPRGDVNGSWAPPAGSLDLDLLSSGYFDELATLVGVPVAQWGL